MAGGAGFKAGPFTGEAYDAAALIMLAMQAAGSADSGKLKDHVMAVANAPGEKIHPGELGKGAGDHRRRRRCGLCRARPRSN